MLVGIPGKSNAFEISKRLGLSSDIIERASSFIKQDHASIEEILKSIYEDKIVIENKRGNTKNLNQIEVLRKSLEHDNSDLLYKKATNVRRCKNLKLEMFYFLLRKKQMKFYKN